MRSFSMYSTGCQDLNPNVNRVPVNSLIMSWLFKVWRGEVNSLTVVISKSSHLRLQNITDFLHGRQRWILTMSAHQSSCSTFHETIAWIVMLSIRVWRFFVTSAKQLISSYLKKDSIMLPCSTSETGAFHWNYCVLNRMCLEAHKEKNHCMNL